MPAPKTVAQVRSEKNAVLHATLLHAVRRATPHHKGHHLHGEEIRAKNDLGQLVVTPLASAQALLQEYPELGVPPGQHPNDPDEDDDPGAPGPEPQAPQS